MRGIAAFVRQRLHRRIFAWFGASILCIALASALAGMLLGREHGNFREAYEGARRLIGAQFAAVWDDPERRSLLARSAASELGIGVVLEDARGAPLANFGPTCTHADFVAPVLRAGAEVGRVRLCAGRQFGPPRGSFAVVLLIAGMTLWGASGVIARKLTRPLSELVRVTNEIGRGNLSTRVARRGRRYGEIAVLADAIDDMARRIEKQVSDQRELLAAVSHEIRSPLARMRVLLELARDSSNPSAAVERIDGIERELFEIDDLVGRLLASSRLDFSLLHRRELDVETFVRGVLERAALSDAVLVCEPGLRVSADPTLIARALANLLENARAYAGAASALDVRSRAGAVEFEVWDEGPGFNASELPLLFESFVRGRGRGGAGSLGLGLALVRRIAVAHGGRAWATNREPRGARVGFSIPQRIPVQSPDAFRPGTSPDSGDAESSG